MNGTSEIEYKGKKIFIIDNSGLEGDAVIKNTASGKKKIINSGNKDARLIVDMTGVIVTREIDTEMTQLGKETLPFVKKNAIVGMALGAKKWLALAFFKSTEKQTDQKVFQTVEEAREWLIKD
jgi:hypothetical protein